MNDSYKEVTVVVISHKSKKKVLNLIEDILYENKYKQEVQKFANEQVGRRRRDDYTDGTVRIPVNSPTP